MKISPCRIRDIFSNTALPDITSIINAWAIEDGVIIGVDLQMSACYHITPPDLNVMNDADVRQYFLGIRNLLHSMPVNTTLHFVFHNQKDISGYLSDYKERMESNSELADLIVDSKISHLSELLLNNRTIDLFITNHPEEQNLSMFNVSSFKIFNRDYKKVSKDVHYSLLSKLNSIAKLVEDGLNNAGITYDKFNDQSILDYFYRYLNPSRSSYLDVKDLSPDATLRSQASFNACEVDMANIGVDGYYYRSVNLLTRPETAHYDMIHNLHRRIKPDYDIVFAVTCLQQDRLMKNIRLDSTIAKNIASFSVFKKNYEAEALASESDEMLDTTVNSHQKLYLYSFCCILRDRSLENLTERTNTAVQAFRELGGADGIIDDMNHLYNFLTVLPGHSHLNFRKHIFPTDTITQMLPLSLSWKGSRDPMLLLQDDEDSLVPINLFDPFNEAHHGLIIGQTGSGKSFTTNTLLANFYIQSHKNHIVIVDVGGSYRKLCSLFGGAYMEVDMSGNYPFNPFPEKDIAVADDNILDYKLRGETESFLCRLIQKLLKRKELSGKEETIISKAIKSTYRNAELDPPILGNLQTELFNFENGDDEDKAIAKDFAKHLDVWVNKYGNVINRRESLNIDSRLVVFDLQRLKEVPELQSIIFFVIQNVIHSKLRDLSLRKYIVVDEGWTFFNDPVGALLVEELYRTLRKFNGAILSISQSPVDFIKSQAADSIIANSQIKYILKLKSNFDTLPKFGLNEKEIEKVRNLYMVKGKFSEVFLKFGNNSTVLRIQPNKIDYWVATTDPDDYNREEELKRKHPELSQAEIIRMLAQED